MVTEGINDQMLLPDGWPFGLGTMTSRIRVVGAPQLVAQSPPTQSHLRRASSFSSFSSSNLDTQSTASFYPDRSVSLGRLIGIKPVDDGNAPDIVTDSDRGHTITQYHSDGLCVPFLHHVIVRMARTGSTSRH